MRLIVEQGTGLRGALQVPGDKSISHRAALFGALATGATRIQNYLRSHDCLATVRCLQALGIAIEENAEGGVTIHGGGLHGLCPPDVPLDCGGSGTTMRLLAGILAGQGFSSTLTENEALQRRPMQRITDPLQRMGANITGREGGRLPPLHISGGSLRGIDYHLPVASAQVKSAILLAGLYATGPTIIHEPGPARDHTERMLSAMGADIHVAGGVITLHPEATQRHPLQPLDIKVPGDISAAAFFIVGACVAPGSVLRLPGVGTNPTRTGLLDILREMGGQIMLENERLVGGEPVADIVVESSLLHAAQVGGEIVPRMIDEFPILAVAATQAEGTTVVRGAAELRVKETDRIAATVSELAHLGARIEECPDGFVIEGPTVLRGATVFAHGDHRLAMALAIAGTLAEGRTIIEGAESIADSFPGFEEMLSSIGGRR